MGPRGFKSIASIDRFFPGSLSPSTPRLQPLLKCLANLVLGGTHGQRCFKNTSPQRCCKNRLDRIQLLLVEKPMKQKQFFGIVPEMGGGQLCLHVAFFFGEQEKEHINKLPRKSQENAGTPPRDSPGIILRQSLGNFVYVFFVYWYFLRAARASAIFWFGNFGLPEPLPPKSQSQLTVVFCRKCPRPAKHCDNGDSFSRRNRKHNRDR